MTKVSGADPGYQPGFISGIRFDRKRDPANQDEYRQRGDQKIEPAAPAQQENKQEIQRGRGRKKEKKKFRIPGYDFAGKPAERNAARSTAVSRTCVCASSPT